MMRIPCVWGDSRLASFEPQSWFEAGFVRGWVGGEEFVKIDRRVFGPVLEAKGDLRVAETCLGRAVAGHRTAAQDLLDLQAELAASAIKIARDAGFVLVQLKTDFGQGLLPGVVQAQPVF